MAKTRSMYQVEFSIDNLSMYEQQRIFQALLAQLNYNQRMDLHVTVTDFMGGKHYIWDGTGRDPDGVFCRECKMIDCENCLLYLKRKKLKEEGAK